MSRRPLLVALALLVAACAESSSPEAATTSTTTTTVETTTTVVEGRYLEPVFDDVSITRDLVYGQAPGRDGTPEDLTLDLYEPAGDDAVDRPAILFFHGGGFSQGDKANGVSPRMAEHFARLGYVTVSGNYRLLADPGCSGASADRCGTAALEGIHDGQAAVRWLRAQADEYGVDGARLGIGGESAGGVIAYGAAAWSDAPGESGTPGESSAVQAFMSLSGGLPSALFADAGDAPGILFASRGDPVVPYQWSVDIEAKWTSFGIPVELVTYEGNVHVPFIEHRDDIIERTTAFFLTHLIANGDQG